MNIGFTGTRHGLTWAQRGRLIHLLRYSFNPPGVFHHGDCVGADAMAHDLARRAGYQIVRHPSLNPKHRAFCNEGVQRKLKRYLDRNHDIVDESDILIACPYQAKEVMRSGTWATVRYARKKGKPVILMFPSGAGGMT